MYTTPTFKCERELIVAGHTVIGIDEAGCGCLAGPVVAAAVQFPINSRLALVRDSKLLSAGQRERLFAEFERRGYRWAIGVASHEEIDAVNIRQATYLAMRRAVETFLDGGNSKSEIRNSKLTRSVIPSKARELVLLQRVPSGFALRTTPKGSVSDFDIRISDFPVRLYALVDAWTIPNLPIPQRGIVHGDRLVKSIAAASIIAKVTRDRMMVDLDHEFPEYGFARHKGYGTKVHRAAIDRVGPCRVHRLTFLSDK